MLRKLKLCGSEPSCHSRDQPLLANTDKNNKSIKILGIKEEKTRAQLRQNFEIAFGILKGWKW